MYQRILVPVDGSDTSNRGLDEAIKIASMTHGKLMLMHAIDDLSFSFALQTSIAYANDWQAFMRQDGEAILERARARAGAAGVEAEVTLSDRYARPVHERIADEANRWDADLIVIGTHGRRGLQRVLMGSAAEGVLRLATKPVLLVRSVETEAATRPMAQQSTDIASPVT